MKNNNFLTYTLYGLLALIIIIAGYYTCQKQKEKKIEQEQGEAELQQTLRNLGYGQGDSTAATGSTFVPGDGAEVSKDGIEKEPEKAPATETKPVNTQTSTPAAPKTVQPTKTSPPKKVAGPGTGRWAVRAGTFSYMDGARRRLEQVIKLGYTNAEISKTKDGKAAVIVYRSNDKNAASNVVDKLVAQGIDAAVFAGN